MYLAQHVVGQDALSVFLDRLRENPSRTGWTAATLIVVGVLMALAVPKVLAILPAFGSSWLTWQIYNKVTAGPDTPLFTGEPTLTSPWNFLFRGGAQFIVSMVGLALGVVVYVLSKFNSQKDKTPLPIRVFAGVGTWFGLVLIYVIYRQFRG